MQYKVVAKKDQEMTWDDLFNKIQAKSVIVAYVNGKTCGVLAWNTSTGQSWENCKFYFRDLRGRTHSVWDGWKTFVEKLTPYAESIRVFDTVQDFHAWMKDTGTVIEIA